MVDDPPDDNIMSLKTLNPLLPTLNEPGSSITTNDPRLTTKKKRQLNLKFRPDPVPFYCFAMELCKQVAWSRTIPRLFHYRTQAGQEVDVVLEDGAGRVVGVEVKANSRVTSADFAGLRHLAEAAGRRFVRGILLYIGVQDIPFAKNLTALPIDSLWRME